MSAKLRASGKGPEHSGTKQSSACNTRPFGRWLARTVCLECQVNVNIDDNGWVNVTDLLHSAAWLAVTCRKEISSPGLYATSEPRTSCPPPPRISHGLS